MVPGYLSTLNTILSKLIQCVLCVERVKSDMAHTALVSLMNTLDLILHSDCIHFFDVKQPMITLYRKIRLLQSLFDDTPQEEMNSMETQIRDSARAIEDKVESKISVKILADPERFMAFRRFGSLPHNEIPAKHPDLEEAIKEIDSLVGDLLNDRCGLKYLLPRKYTPAGSSRPVKSGEGIVMVGLDEDLMELKDRLTRHASKLQTIPIVGMGGTGKTTLTLSLYNDSLVKYHFDVRAWVTISQTYHLQKVLQTLVKDIGVVINKNEKNNVFYLTESLCRSLKGKRYLVVLDDIWSTEVWDDLKRVFPNDMNGSRIVLTSRLGNVADYATDTSSPPHKMHLLDEDASWDLICHKVFAQKGCPPKYKELDDIGKMIARNCRGLPLAASVIGGLLAKSSMTPEVWEYVAGHVNSIAVESDDHYSEILSLSYNHLPPHLKPCFLYFGVFPEDYEISVSKLIQLWIAEGFLKPVTSKRLEEVAEGYLKDLIERNLVLVHRKRSNGETKTCIMHDLLRDLCMKEAEKENFLRNINSSFQFSHDIPPCRLCIHQDILHDGDITDDMWDTMKSMTCARSLLCTGDILYMLPFYQGFRLLRVLDFLKTHFHEFPIEIIDLVNLRYLALRFKNAPDLPSEISLLWKLQVLIINYHIYLYGQLDSPSEILQMPKLRHLQVSEILLPDLVDGNNCVVMKDLETLSAVTNFTCTEDVLKRFPNLRKLGVRYYCDGTQNWSDYHLKNLVRLSKLENLKCAFKFPPDDNLMPNLMFPQSLKTLTLIRSHLFWKDMTIIGSLPHLEVLKLKHYALVGEVWEPVEGEFCQLKFLHIDVTNLMQWRAEKTHFPHLRHLIISRCYYLEEIPRGIGETASLDIIQMDNSSPSAVASAEQILKEQQSVGNYFLQVYVNRSFVGSKEKHGRGTSPSSDS